MTTRNQILLLLPLLATVVRPAEGASKCVFPGATWEQVTPESQNIDSVKLQAAVDYLRKAAGKEGVKRMVIVRNGRMIWRGPEADKPQGVWSVTKAFTSTAHGLLIEDRKCTLDTLAKDYDPALAKYYPTVTLRHFATMTSGLDGVGGGYDFDDQRRGDQNALVEPLPPFFAPGTKYMYWDEATQHYGYTLTQIAGESLHDYLKRRILDPIGITTLNWKRDSTGKVLNWTGGIEISAEDLARFGLLFLNRGNWNGRQLINADWVDQATRVQVPPSIPNALPNSSRKGSGIYGFHWWPNGITPEGERHWPAAPLSAYARSGYNNNDLFVIPAWNMVTVRLGLDEREDKITDAEYNTFLRMVGEAIKDPVVDGERRVWHPVMVRFREATSRAGRPLPVSMDEFTVDKGQAQGWVPVDDARRWCTEKLWPTYLSGGNIEFILGDRLATDSFKTPEREKLWTYVRHARRFIEALPFWEMEPADQLVTGAATISVTQNRGRKTYPMGAQVFTKPGEVDVIYLPKAQAGAALDLSRAAGRFQQRWYNPRTGDFEGATVNVTAGAPIPLGKPPRETGEDWAVLFEKTAASRDRVKR